MTPTGGDLRQSQQRQNNPFACGMAPTRPWLCDGPRLGTGTHKPPHRHHDHPVRTGWGEEVSPCRIHGWLLPGRNDTILRILLGNSSPRTSDRSIRGLSHQLELGFVVLPMPSPNHLPLAEKKTVARRYGVSKLWELCLHFMTGMVQNRGGPQMFLGAKAFCRKGSPPAKKWIQQVEKTCQICHPPDTEKNHKNARSSPPKLSNHFFEVLGRS